MVGDDIPYCCESGLCVFTKAADLIEQLTAELEQVKRERDAAINDLKHKYYGCDACKHYSGIKCALPVEMRKYGFTCWQWRGVCAENGGAEDV